MDIREYWDKVKGCWLGKNAGGTLGMPFEGKREPNDVSYYTQSPGQPAPNDDLDLQLVWLKALEEKGFGITSETLSEYWTKYVVVDWNEYGVARDNLKAGLLPPISGKFRNGWQHSNGAWIRSEIWASVFPGQPNLAASYALMDGSVDHGDGEGTYAELFTAALESMAYFEGDVQKLISAALGYLPEGTETEKAIRTALSSYEKGLGWKEAREAVIRATQRTGWFQAPRNLGYVTIGLLYGMGDFGSSISTAVNCGDDTDCTGATVGSIMGIIKGESGIPEKWKSYIGESIKTVAIGNFTPPKDLNELTKRTVALGLSAGALYGFADLEKGQLFPSSERPRPPSIDVTSVTRHGELFDVTLVYERGVVTRPEVALPISIRILNKVGWQNAFRLIADPALTLPEDEVVVGPQRETSVRALLRNDGYGFASPVLTVVPSASSIPISIKATTFSGVESGMTLRAAENKSAEFKDAEAFDELGRPAGSVIHAVVTDDPARTWHSETSPGPHSVTVKFSEPKSVSEVVVNFVPRNPPTSFEGYAETAEGWVKLFEELNYSDPTGYRAQFPPISVKSFKFLIKNSKREGAELSQIEIYRPSVGVSKQLGFQNPQNRGLASPSRGRSDEKS